MGHGARGDRPRVGIDTGLSGIPDKLDSLDVYTPERVKELGTGTPPSIPSREKGRPGFKRGP